MKQHPKTVPLKGKAVKKSVFESVFDESYIPFENLFDETYLGDRATVGSSTNESKPSPRDKER